MYDHIAAARRNARAKKLLLAAIGIAGCTGGPKLTSATTETPSALVQPGEAAATAESQSRRTFLADIVPGGPTSIWGRRNAESATAPRDPFLAGHAGSARTSTAVIQARRAVPGTVQPVAFEEATAYCGTPTGVMIQPRHDTPGVVRIQDHRLPPAQPLGASNPFAHNRTAAGPKIHATPVATRTTAKPVSKAHVQIEPALRTTATPVPVSEFLAGRVSTDGSAASTVRHEDMIVDTAILPKRLGWRATTLPHRSANNADQFVISARRPFNTPEWDDPTPNRASSANLPIEISPATSFDRTTTAMQVATRSELPAASDITPPATVPDPFDVEDEPFATPEADVALESVDAPEFDSMPPDEPLFVAAAPMLAPGSVVSAGPNGSADAAEASGPQMAPAPPMDVTDSVTVTETSASASGAQVEPVQLEEANASAAREAAARQQKTLGTPAVIGIALAIVAFGAVVIRRRFT